MCVVQTLPKYALRGSAHEQQRVFLARQWGDVALTPTSFLVDQRGLIIKRYVGEPDFAELNQLIERLLPGA